MILHNNYICIQNPSYSIIRLKSYLQVGGDQVKKLINTRDYFRSLFLLFLIGFISLATIGGCNDNNSGGTNQATNQPPQAELEVLRILPGRVDVHAGESFDPDGHIELYDFWLQDADTQEVLAGPVTTREPWATLHFDLGRSLDHNNQLVTAQNRNFGPNVQAMVTVQDNNKAIDTTAAPAPVGAAPSCSNTNFQCTLDSSSGNTTCTPLGNGAFIMSDLLSAAQICDGSLSDSTNLMIVAAGASGGRGADVGVTDGGGGASGGVAAMGTTIAALNMEFGASTMWAFGIGGGGTHNNTHSGTGGAATLLRSSELVNQRVADGVLLIGPGGGGGGAADGFDSGHAGGTGGIAFSSTSGPCPGSTCLSGSTGGNSVEGCTGGGGASGGGSGGGSPGQCNTTSGNPDCGGNSGVGGGGGVADGQSAAYWIQGDPLVNLSEDCDGTPGECNEIYAGQGGPCPEAGDTCHGSGGGGYAGGEAGTSDYSGGGGGGAYAYTSTWEITDKPGTNPNNGYLSFTFVP